jgi:hypothetical protein
MTDVATLETYLTQAQTALHKLMTGDKRVAVSFPDGGSITYQSTDIGALQNYIASLERQINDGSSAGSKRRPFGVEFL